MLSLSQYAILALSCLEMGDGENWILARDVAACTGIPKPCLMCHTTGFHRYGEHSLEEPANRESRRGGFAFAHDGSFSLQRDYPKVRHRPPAGYADTGERKVLIEWYDLGQSLEMAEAYRMPILVLFSNPPDG